jgi:hypothetical protein
MLLQLMMVCQHVQGNVQATVSSSCIPHVFKWRRRVLAVCLNHSDIRGSELALSCTKKFRLGALSLI